jgi:hypothetical protein
MKIDGITLHPSITAERVCGAVEASHVSLEDPGFCLTCGCEQGGCEPDMERGICESCGEPTVYGAEQIMIHLIV